MDKIEEHLITDKIYKNHIIAEDLLKLIMEDFHNSKLIAGNQPTPVKKPKRQSPHRHLAKILNHIKTYNLDSFVKMVMNSVDDPLLKSSEKTKRLKTASEACHALIENLLADLARNDKAGYFNQLDGLQATEYDDLYYQLRNILQCAHDEIPSDLLETFSDAFLVQEGLNNKLYILFSAI